MKRGKGRENRGPRGIFLDRIPLTRGQVNLQAPQVAPAGVSKSTKHQYLPYEIDFGHQGGVDWGVGWGGAWGAAWWEG